MEKNIDIKEQEKRYQAERASERVAARLVPDYVLNRYREAKWWHLFPKEFVFKTIGEFNNKKICDFGCGHGVISTQLAKLGAHVTGVDISQDLIEVARNNANINKVNQNTKFIVADAENIELPVSSFDYLVAYDLLHHVNISFVLPTLLQSLKPEGKAIFVEPIACSNFLQKLRDLIPVKKDASPADHQLNKSDLNLLSNYFNEYEMLFYNLFGRLSRFLPYANKIDFGHPITKFFMICLNGLDRILIKMFPFLWRFCGVVAFVGNKTNDNNNFNSNEK